MIWHDRNPNDLLSYLRAAGLEGYKHIPVEQLTLAELREHYGYQLRQKSVARNIFTSSKREPQFAIPTFAEFAIWAADQPGLEAVYLDTKLEKGQEELAKQLAERVADATNNAKYEIFFSSPNESIAMTYRAWMREHRPAHRAKFIYELEKSGAIAAAKMPDGRAYSPIISWTIDDGEQIAELLDAGVTAIMTNRVPEAVRVNAR